MLKRVLVVWLLVALVLTAGCIGGGSQEGSESASQKAPSETTSEETTSNQPALGDWEYIDFSTSPEGSLGYTLYRGSLSGTTAEVEILVIDREAKFVKTSAYWETSPDIVLADNVVFQVGDGAHYFEIMSDDVHHESFRVVGDLFDFLKLNSDKYLGWENGVVRIYSKSLNKYREKRGVLGYAATLINGEFAIVTTDGDAITVTTFSNGEASEEEYTFDCSVLYLHPAFEGSEIGGFYMGTTCGLYHVDSSLMYLDSGLEHVSWDIISNDHDEVGGIVVYSEDLGQVVGLYYDADADEVYYSEPIEVSSKPTAASLSGLYLGLLYGNELYIYQLRNDNAYHEFAVIDLPYIAEDVKIVQLDEETLEIGVAWKSGFAHIVVTLDQLEGTHSLTMGEVITSGSESSGEGSTTTSTSTPQGGTESELERIMGLFEIEKVKFGELWGAKIHLKATPDYRNVHDWLQIKTYEPAGLPDAYFAFGNYMVHVTSAFKNLVENGEEFTKYDVSEIYELPATPRDFTFGRYDTSDIFMAGTDGRLYLIYDTYWSRKEVNGEKIRYQESRGYVSWDIDADGVNVMARGDYSYFVAWKDDRIYVITYTDEQFYNAEEEGLPKVQPKEVQLPEKIVAVYPLDYGWGFLIRTETGLYLYDVMGHFDYGPDKLYTLLTDVPGMTAVQIYTDDAYIYRDGIFTRVYVSSKYDANDKEVPKVKVVSSRIAIPGVRVFAPMFNTYDTQLAIGFDGRIALYNVSIVSYYDENNNRVEFLNLTLDQAFSVPFTPDYVYGEDECYCHVRFHADYFYAWAGNDYYVLFGPNNRRW